MDEIKSKAKITVDAKRYSIFKRVLTFMLVISMLFIGGTAITAQAGSDDTDAYNLSAVGNALANVFSLSLTPTGEGGITPVKLLSGSCPGDGGLVVGITGKTTSVGQWIASMISGSSAAYDYISLQGIDNGDEKTDAAYYYAVYGHLLKDTGFDKTTTNTTGNVHPIRAVAGTLILISYWFATLIYKLFSVSLTILQAINPFFWLSGIAADYSTAATTAWTNATTNATFSTPEIYSVAASTDTGTRGVLVSTIANIYVTMANLSWGVTIPLLIAFYFFGLFALKKTVSTRRLLTKIIFLAVGIPVMGALYTGFLDDMKDLFDSQTSTCDQIILSTFVDFENWAKYSHLAIGDGMTLSSNLENKNGNTNATAGTATSATIAKLRTTCLAINKKAGSAAAYLTSSADESDSSNIASSVVISSYAYTRGTASYVANILTRYMTGDTYTSDSFASYAQTSISNETGIAENITAENYAKLLKAVVNLNNYDVVKNNDTWWQSMGGAISSLWSSSAEFSEIADLDNTNYEQLANDVSTLGGQQTIFNDGNITESFVDSASTTYTYDTYDADGDSYVSNLSGVVTFQQSGGVYGLSTMSMYNYLSTDFTNDSVVVYGGGNAIASGLTQKQHSSVNIIGTGIMSLIYWSDCLVLLSCISLIGVFYSIGMLGHAIKNSLNIITAMPVAMLGSMRYMSKFIGIVLTMIANVLITAILYSLACNFLLGISQFIEAIISTSIVLKATAIAGTLTGFTLIARLIVNIFFIIITVQLIKIRKQTINQITEWVQQVVTKFMEADSHGNPDKPKAGIGQKAMSGLAQGAGMAVGNQMAKGAQSAIGGALGFGGASAGDKAGGDKSGSGSEGTNTATGNTIEQEGGNNSYDSGSDSSQNYDSSDSVLSANESSESSSQNSSQSTNVANDNKSASSGDSAGGGGGSDDNKASDKLGEAAKAAEMAESADKSGTATVGKEAAKDLSVVTDKNASGGDKAKAVARGAAVAAGTYFGGAQGGAAVSKGADAVEGAASKAKSAQNSSGDSAPSGGGGGGASSGGASGSPSAPSVDGASGSPVGGASGSPSSGSPSVSSSSPSGGSPSGSSGSPSGASGSPSGSGIKPLQSQSSGVAGSKPSAPAQTGKSVGGQSASNGSSGGGKQVGTSSPASASGGGGPKPVGGSSMQASSPVSSQSSKGGGSAQASAPASAPAVSGGGNSAPSSNAPKQSGTPASAPASGGTRPVSVSSNQPSVPKSIGSGIS